VLTGSGTDATAVLDGFTIMDGNAEGGPPLTGWGSSDIGGGLFCFPEGGPTVVGCTFLHNRAVQGGGAVFVNHGALTVIGCRFLANQTDFTYGAVRLEGDPAGLVKRFINCE